MRVLLHEELPRVRAQRDGHVLERVFCAGQDVRKIARAPGLKCAIGGKGGCVPVIAQAQAGKENQNLSERPLGSVFLNVMSATTTNG